MANKPRTKVKFQVFQHEDDDDFVDLTLELTNFPRESLFNFLTAIREPFANSPSQTPPDES
ncbi:MAG: hypothetical protein V7K25_13280 [Nostoc sp.]|uniref:hypothetical protein n=1 Tax=Nostoc sp. TaxID=1180 RepID=UPI002FF53D96